MAEYRIRDTGQTMLEIELRQWARSTSGASWNQTTEEVLEAIGADLVFEGPQAATTPPYEYSTRQGIEQVEGKWYTKYVAGPIFTDTPEATAAEQETAYKARMDDQQATSVRADRNARLAATDWMVVKTLEAGQLQDFPVAAYRQALRDIPSQPGFPWDIIWPEAPQ
jgi:hypothetical protein